MLNRRIESDLLPVAQRFGLGVIVFSPLLERLYALGLDAFALAQMLAEPVPPERVEIDGATGHLSLTPARVFSREGRVMLIHDGRVQTDPAVQ